MKVSEAMELFQIKGWRELAFWFLNVPRFLLGMDIVIYKWMAGVPLIDGVSKVYLELGRE